MIFGLNLPNYSGLGNRESMLAIAAKAEDLGYSSLWTSDHILIPTSHPEPFGNLLETFTTLSYLAARTETIRLGTGILVLPMRDPLLVAKQAATVHHLSGGRLTLGVGVGWIAEEYAFLRTDFGARGRLADEFIAAIGVLFESDRPEFHGDHIDFADALFSPRPPVPIRILVGGGSRAALRLAATLGDGWLGLWPTPEAARDAITEMDRIGHRPGLALSARLQVRVGGEVADADPATTLHGDAAGVIERLHEYRDAGIEQVVIEPLARDLADFAEQMRLFAHDVAPGLYSAAVPPPTEEMDRMLQTPPAVVERFINSADNRDFDAIATCFTEDGTVEDEDRTHRGRRQIRAWQQESRSKWDYTVTVVSGEPAGESDYRVTAHLTGNFPGGEADVEYRFSVRAGLISHLRIS